jgi:DNA replicative helicase MCM subunit Mcm2 (Cdc46/Mcm family)
MHPPPLLSLALLPFTQVLPLLDAALALAQEQLRAQQPDGASLAVKDAVHARLAGLALHRDGWAAEVSPGTGGVGAAHLDRLLTVVGTVSKAGPAKMLEARRLYECGRCKHRQACFPRQAARPACLLACQQVPARRPKACRRLGGSMRGHHSYSSFESRGALLLPECRLLGFLPGLQVCCAG